MIYNLLIDMLAPIALIVNTITDILAGIDWRRIGEDILGLAKSKCDEISSRCSTDEERAGAVVREWLLRDPLASWRRIIEQLYKMELLLVDTKYRTLGDSILHYAEELTGMYNHDKFYITLHHIIDNPAIGVS